MRLFFAIGATLRFLGIVAMTLGAIVAPILLLVNDHPLAGGLLLLLEIFVVLTWVFYQEDDEKTATKTDWS